MLDVGAGDGYIQRNQLSPRMAGSFVYYGAGVDGYIQKENPGVCQGSLLFRFFYLFFFGRMPRFLGAQRS